MFNDLADPTRLEIHYHFNAPPERIFRAWTDPELLRQWFRAGPGFSTPIAEVDLQVGGRFRIGLQPPNSSRINVASGVYRLIQPPNKLVFTWCWDYDPQAETLVTLELIAKGQQTELVLTHQNFSNTELRSNHARGWAACLDSLSRVLEEQTQS